MLKNKTKKSNHKHLYKDCLFKYNRRNTITGQSEIKHVRGQRCSVCGKIKNIIYFESETIISESGSRVRRMLDDKEMLEKYKHLSVYEIDSSSDVPLL